MNKLENFFYNQSDKLIHKWDTYFGAYDKYFSKYTNKPIKILEIGVFKGGSLQMWKNYFGPQAKIVGMDINPECKILQEDQIEIFIADQGNINDLKSLIKNHGNFDIIIDDGSHVNKHQIDTFDFLFEYLNLGGIYLVEDTHTSYWDEYGYEGGYKRENTFIEYAKSLLDDINGYSIRPNPIITKYTNYISDIHICYGMVFFEKNKLKYTPHDIVSEKGEITAIGLIQQKNEI